MHQQQHVVGLEATSEVARIAIEHDVVADHVKAPGEVVDQADLVNRLTPSIREEQTRRADRPRQRSARRLQLHVLLQELRVPRQYALRRITLLRKTKRKRKPPP